MSPHWIFISEACAARDLLQAATTNKTTFTEERPNRSQITLIKVQESCLTRMHLRKQNPAEYL